MESDRIKSLITDTQWVENGYNILGEIMTDAKDVLTKETGQLKMKRIAPMRTYDLIDLFCIGVYNLFIFSAGLGLGWYLWNASN
jgi:hypothetical protein